MTGFPKPEKRKTTKARRKRVEGSVTTRVRAACVRRDGPCRLRGVAVVGACAGPSQWAHVGVHRRFQTRGQSPALRHTTAGSCMLCQRHHEAYDAHLFTIDGTTAGADGNLVVTWVHPLAVFQEQRVR